VEPVHIVVEGDSDAVIVDRVLTYVGLEVGSKNIQRGKARLDQKLPAYNNAARHGRWFVLRDLDADATCASELVGRLLPHPAPHMRLRIAVRAAEAWLIADRDNLMRFLKVGAQHVPTDSDDLADPKQSLVNLARRSRDRSIRDDMVPEEGVSARIGAGYVGRLIEFAADSWNPAIAATNSRSLRRCIEALKRWSGGEKAPPKRPSAIAARPLPPLRGRPG
jgi:hypothetical protein